MFRALCLAASLILHLCISLNAQTKYEISLNIEEKVREFIVSVPSTPPPPDGYPLVMMLHGTSGDMNVFYQAKGWKELGEQENFVTIFPSALKWCFDDEGVIKNNTKFVCGDLTSRICPSDSSDLIDDVHFLRTIVNLVSDSISIDENKIFGSGFSNGGCMIHKLGMEAGDLFKAVGAAAGTYHSLDSISPPVRIPIWFIVGSLDDRFIVPPFVELPFGGDSILGYLNKPINRTLVSLGLTTEFTKTETALTKTYLFANCLPNEECTPYQFTLIKNLSHQYPNGSNHPVDAPAAFWNFFNNPPGVLVSTDNTLEMEEWNISCFPNPATTSMHIYTGIIGKSVRMEVYNQTGMHIVSQNSENGEFILNKETTGSGIFFLQIHSEGNLKIEKVTFL